MNTKPNRCVVVLDTNIFLSAFLGERGFREDESILEMEQKGMIRFAFSPQTLNELYAILSGKVHQFRLFHCHEIFLQLCSILSRSILLHPPRLPRLSTDPSDQMFVDLAVAVNATYHITRDTKNGLLDQQAFESTRFVTPAQFLKQFRHVH